jgi:hypothetical protein
MRMGIIWLLGVVALMPPACCQAGERASAVAAVTGGFVSSITVTSEGSGYVQEPGVSLTGGGGSGAVAKAFLNGGRVASILVLNAGGGYTTTPTVTIEEPPTPQSAVVLALSLAPKLTLKGPPKTLIRLESSTTSSGPWVLWTNLVAGLDGTVVVDLRPDSRALHHRAVSLLDFAHQNSLGMYFAPVAGAGVRFSIWETRVQDYAAYARATGDDSGPWLDPTYQNEPVTPGPTHPVVNVSWEDARDFCQWLTAKERLEGKLGAEQSYRLPTDAEWSWAVGIGNLETGSSPKAKSERIADVYPWGERLTPLRLAGNYFGSFPEGSDVYSRASPVGSFMPNPAGLHDMGGNVWEWCEDSYEVPETTTRVVRGASWTDSSLRIMLSSFRGGGQQSARNTFIGFRCVLVGMP